MGTVNQPSKKDSQNELLDEDYLMNIMSGDIEVKSTMLLVILPNKVSNNPSTLLLFESISTLNCFNNLNLLLFQQRK
ncbi:hypothetical protein SAMN05421818_11821 [Myroides phaeus]|uniref:Uncharacterized protein n=1 Tax=Myroides phaeus TaxID=702745 RepID=A0A1G8FQ02_9FLAO|nr:hypothetical protein SAMN05421818_11821 [Myroides phaeus]